MSRNRLTTLGLISILGTVANLALAAPGSWTIAGPDGEFLYSVGFE